MRRKNRVYRETTPTRTEKWKPIAASSVRRRIENCEFLTEKKKIFFWAEKKNKIFHHFIMRVEKAGKPLLLEEMIRKKKFVKLLKRLAMKNRNV